MQITGSNTNEAAIHIKPLTEIFDQLIAVAPDKLNNHINRNFKIGPSFLVEAFESGFDIIKDYPKWGITRLSDYKGIGVYCQNDCPPNYVAYSAR